MKIQNFIFFVLIVSINIISGLRLPNILPHGNLLTHGTFINAINSQTTSDNELKEYISKLNNKDIEYDGEKVSITINPSKTSIIANTTLLAGFSYITYKAYKSRGELRKKLAKFFLAGSMTALYIHYVCKLIKQKSSKNQKIVFDKLGILEDGERKCLWNDVREYKIFHFSLGIASTDVLIFYNKNCSELYSINDNHVSLPMNSFYKLTELFCLKKIHRINENN